MIFSPSPRAFPYYGRGDVPKIINLVVEQQIELKIMAIELYAALGEWIKSQT